MRNVLLITLLLLSQASRGQTLEISGRVISEEEPGGLPGVNVVIKGSTGGTITDIDGRFQMEATPGDVLVFSFVGYETQEVTVAAGTTVIDVTLLPTATQLETVVVMGYSSVERTDITGSVATVNVENMTKLSINGLDQGLQGMAPGVQVTQSSGTPGGGVKVHIRGPSSIGASNVPLYVVDGIPVETGSLGGRGFGGQNDNALALLNPNDIESMTILKDASAVALYGSRGSNGVVVITTKKGRVGAPRITADVQRGMIDPVGRIELLNSTELLELQREAVINSGQNPDAFGLVTGVTDAVDTDWIDAIMRTGILQQYQLSVSGGNDFTRYYISGGYRREEGVQLNNLFERLNTTINLDQKLSDKLSLGSNITLSRGMNKRVKGDNFLDGVYSGALKSLPYHVPHDENGFLVGPGSPLYPGFPNFNPVAQAVLPRFNTTSVKILGNLNATYRINDHFSALAKVALDYNDVTEDQYESSQTAIGGFLPNVGGQGYGIFIANTFSRIISYGTLSYNRELGQNKTISAVGGVEFLRENSIGGNVQGRLFPSDDFTYITSAGIVDAGGSLKSPPHTLLSYFAEARLNYEDRFHLTATFRADGSSNFGPNQRFGYFPAASVAWRVSNEKFFHSGLITDLKLRASFGLTGNERIPAFQFIALWGPVTYNGVSGVGPSNTDNPDIRWESKREVNAGLDISLWNGRLQTSIDAYYNKSFDLLLGRPFPLTTGFGSMTDNIGDMENRGIEFTTTTVNIDRKNLTWRTTINLSKNLNKVLFLADSVPLYTGYTAEGVEGTNIVKVGEPLGSFWGLNFLGVNPATGDAIYEDSNGDGVINNDDAMVIGNAQPDLIGGVTNSLTYKAFDLSFFFQFSLGNDVLNFTKATLVNMGADLQSNQSVEALRRWRQPGDVTDIPRYEFESTGNNLHSNRLLEDGSYLRLKNVNLGYTLPPNLSGKLRMERLRVYVSATNLWTLTGYSGADPEVSTLDGSTSAQGIDFFTLPQVRTISAGLTATLR